MCLRHLLTFLPINFRYKGVIIGIMSYSTTCIVLYSTSYTSAIPGLEDAFGISTTEGVLGMTTYMLGTNARDTCCSYTLTTSKALPPELSY